MYAGDTKSANMTCNRRHGVPVPMSLGYRLWSHVMIPEPHLILLRLPVKYQFHFQRYSVSSEHIFVFIVIIVNNNVQRRSADANRSRVSKYVAKFLGRTRGTVELVNVFFSGIHYVHFRSKAQFFSTDARKNSGKWPTGGFSAITPLPVKRSMSNAKKTLMQDNLAPLTNAEICQQWGDSLPTLSTFRGRVPTPCTDWREISHDQADPSTPQLCQITRKSVQGVYRSGTECWLSASE